MIEFMKEIARRKAVGNRTGWARRDDILVAYYPRCKRFAYFLKPWGAINRRDLEARLEVRS